MYSDGNRPTFTIGLAAVLLAGLASTLLSVAYATTMLGQAVSLVLFDPIIAARLALDRGGVLRGYVVVAVCLVIVQLIVRALVAWWVVAEAGAFVSFGRALAAFVVSDVFAVAGTGLVASFGTTGLWLPLDWIGIAVATAILCAGGRATLAPESVRTYARPPDAPRDWPLG